MPTVRLPFLEADSHCERLTVCGAITVEDGPLRKWLKKLDGLEARYQRKRRHNYVLMMADEEHLHIDVAVRAYFGDSPPKAKDKVTDIYGVLDRLVGRNITAHARGVYRLPIDAWPEFIRNMVQVEAKVGAVSLTTSGGSFLIQGAPATSLEWWLSTRTDLPLGIGLGATRETIVGASYLEECFEDLQKTFNAVVLGRQP